MLFYFGTEWLDILSGYYGGRLQQAYARGYQQTDSKYHWLYSELDFRVRLLRQTQLFLRALPQYLIASGSETAMGYVTSYIGDWFSESMVGVLPRDDAGHCAYFSEENPYWVDVQESLQEVGKTGINSVLPLHQLALTEYVVRCIRLALFLREKQFKAIDRDKFDSLMSVNTEVRCSD